MITNLKLYILLLFSILTVGCSSMGVEPWERNILAEKDMIFHTDVIAVKFEEQFYHSKEGSSGGRGFSGGGCGCN